MTIYYVRDYNKLTLTRLITDTRPKDVLPTVAKTPARKWNSKTNWTETTGTYSVEFMSTRTDALYGV